MRSIAALVIILACFFIFWFYFKGSGSQKEETKEKPIAESKHSAGFNYAITTAMNSYYKLSEAFVNWDSAAVKVQAQSLKKNLDLIGFDELRKDSTGIAETASLFIIETKNDADSIAANPYILKQREGLNNLTQNLYDFLRTVKYDRSKLYLQQCPMAFNETNAGVWLSKVPEIVNPYMGLHHPRYGRAMLACGETKDTLNFIPSSK
ncbi:MAG: hypothetical protein NVS1B13_22820 [Flavisolibacter sp.]